MLAQRARPTADVVDRTARRACAQCSLYRLLRRFGKFSVSLAWVSAGARDDLGTVSVARNFSPERHAAITRASRAALEPHRPRQTPRRQRALGIATAHGSLSDFYN